MFYDLERFKAGKDRLRSIELTELGDVSAKKLLHLRCHFGLDTMSWARRGAVVSGVDFSKNAIDLAKSLSAELDIPADFVCSDIYDLRECLSGEFDIVFTSYGVLHGLPDVNDWAEIISHFLKPGGFFYIVEDHPMFRVFRPNPGDEFRVERPYFYTKEPERNEAVGSYATSDQDSEGVSYLWNHSLGDIINSLTLAGLMLESLHEFPYAARAKSPFMIQGKDGWWRLPPHHHGIIPFLFSLLARKPTHIKEASHEFTNFTPLAPYF